MDTARSHSWATGRRKGSTPSSLSESSSASRPEARTRESLASMRLGSNACCRGLSAGPSGKQQAASCSTTDTYLLSHSERAEHHHKGSIQLPGTSNSSYCHQIALFQELLAGVQHIAAPELSDPAQQAGAPHAQPLQHRLSQEGTLHQHEQ